MNKLNRAEETVFRDVSVQYSAEHFVCPVCSFEVDDLKLAGENQRAIADAYRKTVRLLTSEEIIQGRKRAGWSQEDLAKAIGVGVASVKRWERGQIQTPVMDRAMRAAFGGKSVDCDSVTGNRPLSLGRIKLVLQCFSHHLGNDQLEGEGNRLLYPAKYLWYADMICFRETGRSMTGATYAALTHGPQINNYGELIDLIRGADETAEEELSDQERRIIQRIAMAFPTGTAAHKASHQEEAWKSKRTGTLIPYTDASTVTAV
jgi:putative zinc finger/helix-turn-helix YgiT family protein